ncbi:hypothetical protein SLS64_013274 [Diaporthe eres]
MRSAGIATAVLATLVAGAVNAGTVSVSGKAEGFASGVTGGGDATPVYPADIEELKTYLTSDEPQVVVLDKTFDFLNSEGTKTETGCAPYTTEAGCQQAIDATGTWCSSDVPSVEVTYDVAATEGIELGSNKTIIGVDDKGVIIGKGFRMTNGASNIIIQNIKIENLNPQYVWGGDALTFSGADLIWVDHVTTQDLGRQHYVFGQTPSHRITLSNNDINGNTNYSAGCDTYHYWTIELVGTDDQITFKNNYIHHTAGRSPALSGSTLFHAVNSLIMNCEGEDNNGHAIEGDTNGQGLFEGCVFKDVKQTVVDDFKGHLFSVGSTSATRNYCKLYLGRNCVENIITNSSEFAKDDTSFFSNFTGLTVASAESPSTIQDTVPSSAGFGKLS